MAIAIAGCETGKKSARVPSVSVVDETKGDKWQRVATDADERRLQRIGLAWTEALDEAKRRNPGDIVSEGALLDRDAALPRPAPTPGSYNCRLVRLGRVGARGPVFERFKPFYCYVEVEGELLTIVKQTGSERPAGRLWEDDIPERMIFLGAVARADEKEPPAYGDHPNRDVAGVFERVGPFRWRLVIPWPQGNSKLDIFELTPVADQPQ